MCAKRQRSFAQADSNSGAYDIERSLLERLLRTRPDSPAWHVLPVQHCLSPPLHAPLRALLETAIEPLEEAPGTQRDDEAPVRLSLDKICEAVVQPGSSSAQLKDVSAVLLAHETASQHYGVAADLALFMTHEDNRRAVCSQLHRCTPLHCHVAQVACSCNV
jgi:hypothetical protein